MLWVLIRSTSEVLLISTHNIRFYGKIEKIQELSSNTPPYKSSEKRHVAIKLHSNKSTGYLKAPHPLKIDILLSKKGLIN